EGSCDPALEKCNKRYVDQLDQPGRDTVLGGGNTYSSLREAREFINRLRTENVLDSCSDVAKQPEASGSATPSSPPPVPPPSDATAPPEVAGSLPAKPTPIPGVNCRPEHNEGGGG